MLFENGGVPEIVKKSHRGKQMKLEADLALPAQCSLSRMHGCVNPSAFISVCLFPFHILPPMPRGGALTPDLLRILGADWSGSLS